MLEEMQHARTIEQDERKAYAITDEGEADLKEHEDEVADFYEGHDAGAWETPAEDVARVMKRVGQLIKAFKRGTQRGYLGARQDAKDARDPRRRARQAERPARRRAMTGPKSVRWGPAPAG